MENHAATNVHLYGLFALFLVDFSPVFFWELGSGDCRRCWMMTTEEWEWKISACHCWLNMKEEKWVKFGQADGSFFFFFF